MGNVLGMEDMLGREIQDDLVLKMNAVNPGSLFLRFIRHSCDNVVLLLHPDCTVHLVLQPVKPD